MISILIPVFNVTVFSLVQELSKQLNSLSIDGEILVFDDHSDLNFRSQNKILNSFENVSYTELDRNFGRTGIRNLLAQNARCEWLLFIDSDSVIIDDKYLSNYFLTIIGQQYDVYSGGRIYQPQQPENCNKRLHWIYGTKRESVKGAGSVLHSNNFIIRKEVFLELNFPPQIQGYGHEDTWMELELRTKKRKIQFLRNPVLHEGLEDSAVFLEKTKSALRNLLLLPDFFDQKKVSDQVRLYKLFYWQNRFGIASIVEALLNTRIRSMEKNLKSCNPSLFFFDCYRLFQLMRLAKKSSKG